VERFPESVRSNETEDSLIGVCSGPMGLRRELNRSFELAAALDGHGRQPDIQEASQQLHSSSSN
jgi:hypothetical protein